LSYTSVSVLPATCVIIAYRLAFVKHFFIFFYSHFILNFLHGLQKNFIFLTLYTFPFSFF